PCESKSSPAHYSKHPLTYQGVFFYVGGKRKEKNNKKSRSTKQGDDKNIDRLWLELSKYG
ncbi:MAG: hypothetical protein ACN6NW_04440, partial [Acinetobacter amyesii]|uniref:hypothetical protein n=1 Tax=Acinetobacter amyesii TaxID=2942470 RepID=UPI003D050DAD